MRLTLANASLELFAFREGNSMPVELFNFDHHLDAAPDQVVQALSSSNLELIILPTEHCNFRCLYCYEDFQVGRMKRPVVESIKKLISLRMV